MKSRHGPQAACQIAQTAARAQSMRHVLVTWGSLESIAKCLTSASSAQLQCLWNGGLETGRTSRHCVLVAALVMALVCRELARITGRVYVTSDSKEKIALFSLTVASEEHESAASASAIPATMVTSANRIDVRTAESMPIWTSSSQSLSARVMGNARTMVVCVTQASPVTTVLP